MSTTRLASLGGTLIAIAIAVGQGFQFTPLSVLLLITGFVFLALAGAKNLFGVTNYGRGYWLEMEEAFGRIPGEVDAEWVDRENGSTDWSCSPRREDGGTDRSVELFRYWARAVGQAARSQGRARRHPSGSSDRADYWLSVVAAAVAVEEGWYLQDSESAVRKGRVYSGDLEKVIEASRATCARFAAESRD
jgi:hypothetical protein